MNPLRTERIYERQVEVLLHLLANAITAVQAGHPLDSLMARFYRDHAEFGSRDRRLFSSIVFAFFRWKGWLDIVAPDLKTAAIWAHLLDSREIHPAIAKLAEICAISEATLSPLGSLTISERANKLGQFTGHTLTGAKLLPDWATQLPELNDARLIEAFQNSPPTWLRVAPDQRESILAALKTLDIEPTPHPHVYSAISVPRGINLRSLPRDVRTRIDIQDLSSQVAALTCTPLPGQTWWDACAGSGGKTLHLATLAGATASILATDIRPTILESLHRRLAEAGIQNVSSAVWNGMHDPPPQGPFDGILLDAPCSGIGTWHRNPDARWRITKARLKDLVALQSRLLDRCTTRLKPGGVLIYATCTLTTMENEAIIRKFLEGAPDFKLESFMTPLDQTPCNGTRQIMPWEGPCNGMFIAKLRAAGNFKQSTSNHHSYRNNTAP